MKAGNLKIGVLAAALALSMGLAACGGSSDGESAGTAAAATAAGTVSEDGYYYTSNGVDIRMNADAAAVTDALGEPEKYFESKSCAFEGLDKVYTYKGFKLNTYPVEDKDYVLSVVFMDDTVETNEGVTIGSTADEVRAACGDPTTEKDTSLVYEKSGTKMTFILEDGTVKSVEIAAITKES